MKEYELGQAARRGRREFLKRSMLLVAAGVAAGTRRPRLRRPRGRQRPVRIGLVGCGGRGTGAAAEALTADPNVKLVALADLFEDRLLSSIATLKKNQDLAGKIDVPPERRFVGFEAYKTLITSGIDVVFAAPLPARALKAAVAANLHIFAEAGRR